MSTRRVNSAIVDLLVQGQQQVEGWEAHWPPFDLDPTLEVAPGVASTIIAELGQRLHDNYPFFHPRYAGQMIKPPHPIALAAYAMAQRINPNAHALDGGPATSYLEIEVIRQLAAMFGYEPESSLGHLTSSGTIANLEALWISRESDPGKAIAFSEAAHYTHRRMCGVLAVPSIEINVDERGRMNVDQLETALRRGGIGTVVATAGTTSLGAVDPIHEIVALAKNNGARVHVDAAYGGFFAMLAQNDGSPVSEPSNFSLEAFKAIADSDSVVVDPHKHGLQPYGCGSVLFRDAIVGRFYQHESPYTYFTSGDLHLGEISLECSRAGATAAALWATLQAFPLKAESGFGPILQKTLLAARRMAALVNENDRLQLVVEPELDIVCFFPLPAGSERRTSTISELTTAVFADLMRDPLDPLYLATLQVEPGLLRSHDLEWDTETLTTFRSVLMKPEHDEFIEALMRGVEKSLH
ncbi:aminotransferase class V-fold PLP-dependent enzyme [soil metagenome]